MLAQLRNENKHAAEAFREALAIDPEHHGSEAALNQLKAAAGDAKIADELLAKIDRATDWRSLQRIAESFFAAGDYASSKAIFDEALLALSKADDTNAATRSEVATALSARRADAHYELGAVRAAAMGEGFADTVRDLPVEQMLLKLDEIMRRIHGDTVKVSWGLHDGKAHVSMSQRACEHLHALADLPLVGVNVGKSGVRDLGPLAGLPLRSLVIYNTQITDLEPIAGAPLRTLNICNTKITHLRALRDAKLQILQAWESKLRDLSALSGQPLAEVYLDSSSVTDIEPLRGAPIKKMRIANTAIASIDALARSPIEDLEAHGTKVREI